MAGSTFDENRGTFELINHEEMLYQLLCAKTGPALKVLSVLIFLETEGWTIRPPEPQKQEEKPSNIVSVDFRLRKKVERKTN